MIRDLLNLYVERREFFIELIIEHLKISIIAILISAIIGITIGIWISEHRKTSKLIIGITNFIYTIPSISLLGFLIPLSGIGNKTAIIALTLYGLLPMIRNTYEGITGVNKEIIEVAEAMGSTKIQVLYKVKLPLAMGVIIAGFRNMVVMTVALGGIASFIGAGGLGIAIYRGITTNNSLLTIAGSLLIAILAITLDLIIGIIEKRVKRGLNL